jgi:NADPH:quinone reductase-like Zn-dependent oxidoreductase
VPLLLVSPKRRSYKFLVNFPIKHLLRKPHLNENFTLCARIMDKWIGRVAIVTGASSGIGAALCVRLANKGMKVVGAARRQDKIQVK